MQKVSMIKKLNTFINIFLSIFVVFAININLDKALEIKASFFGNNILTVVLFFVIIWLLQRISKIENKRLKICSFILAVIFALFEIVGASINTYLDLSGILGSKTIFLKSCTRFLGYVILFYAILTNIFDKLEKVQVLSTEPKWFSDNKKSFFLVWAIIFIAWLPYFLNYYPGILTNDSILQIYQAVGIDNFSNNHPFFHTICIGIALHIGKIFESYNLGVGIYSFMQMLFMSAIFSFTIYYMAKRKADIRLRGLVLLFYALYPVNALYSITMWKDIPFTGMMLLLTILLAELAIDKDKFMNSKRNIAFLIVSMILVMLFRNNGFYVILLTIPFLFIFAKKYYKKMIFITCMVFGFYIIWKNPIFALFNVQEGLKRRGFIYTTSTIC